MHQGLLRKPIKARKARKSYLADDDGAGSQDEDGFDVRSFLDGCAGVPGFEGRQVLALLGRCHHGRGSTPSIGPGDLGGRGEDLLASEELGAAGQRDGIQLERGALEAVAARWDDHSYAYFCVTCAFKLDHMVGGNLAGWASGGELS